jgi:hypothetical protein
MDAGKATVLFRHLINPLMPIELMQLYLQVNPIPVTITMTITGGAFPTFTGPITTTGDLIPPAEGSMYVNSFGNVFHCIITMVTSEGTITIREECNKTTFMGQWQIVDGTGAYANLRGNGKVMMPRRQEVLEGTIAGINSDK